MNAVAWEDADDNRVEVAVDARSGYEKAGLYETPNGSATDGCSDGL